MNEALAEPQIRIDSYLNGSALDTMAEDVRQGLTRELPELPPKYFYDQRGSDLFDRITALPEYYPTRCERSILNRRAPVIVDLADSRELVELGSGSASKTRALLFAMAGAGALERYLPVDVSESVVARCAEELVETYPGLRVHGVVGDFEQHLERVPVDRRPLVAFLGGTIGNFYPAPRAAFLASVRDLLGDDGRLLLGTDLVKDVAVLEGAYNDSAGVTAEFNRNVLNTINRELGANFDPAAFEHVAYWDAEQSWIEMRLRACGNQYVRIEDLDLELRFPDGEEIRTEISAKFTRDGLEAELAEAGMRLEAFFSDDDGYFALSLIAPGA